MVDPSNNISDLRSVRGRRRVWRVEARRAAEQARDEDRVGEAQCPAEEAEGQKLGQGQKARHARRCSENFLLITIMFLRCLTETSTCVSARP